MWSLRALIEHADSVHINGRWVPARPVPLSGIGGLRMRIGMAWAVLRGKADAFTWPEGQ